MTLLELIDIYEHRTGESARYASNGVTGYRRDFLLWLVEQLNSCFEIIHIYGVNSMIDLDTFLEKLGFDGLEQMEESDLGDFLETVDDYDD
jgi:hypothetical protein